MCIFGVESINITSLSREHVTHALYTCYMTMSCICQKKRDKRDMGILPGHGVGSLVFQDPQTGWTEPQTETDNMGNKRSHMICSLT